MFVTDEDGVMRVFIRTPYNYSMRDASIATGLACSDGTRTQQQFKDECDINTILDRFGVTGELPSNVRVPLEGEFHEVFDFQTAMNKINEAEAAFMQMPAKVRARFGNDPQSFLEFAHDPKNRDEAKALGLLLDEPPKPSPLEVHVVNAPVPGST